jgi:RNA polymerase sigma-70 factor (ECF subfamily)
MELGLSCPIRQGADKAKGSVSDEHYRRSPEIRREVEAAPVSCRKPWHVPMKDEGPAPPSDPPKIERKDLPNESEGIKALEELMPLVYEELRLLAGGYLRNERPEHTLQRTALVHEAYLRLLGQRRVGWENRGHFLGIFARLMRQTLTNHAVARQRAKRGGNDPTELILEFYERRQIDVTAVDDALRELEILDPRQAQIVELRFFGGLTVEEIARLLEISPATVKREWAVAKLWLRQALSQRE